MLLLDFFRLYPVTQILGREEADIEAIRSTAQQKPLITSESDVGILATGPGASVTLNIF